MNIFKIFNFDFTGKQASYMLYKTSIIQNISIIQKKLGGHLDFSKTAWPSQSLPLTIRLNFSDLRKIACILNFDPEHTPLE